MNLGEEGGVKGQLLKVSHELSNSFNRQSSNKLPGILADCCLPRPSKVCVEHHTEGRKGCVTISEGFRQLQILLQALLMDGNYLITFHRGKEPAAARADGGSRSKKKNTLWTWQGCSPSMSLTLTSSSSCNLPPGGSSARPAATPLTLGTPALRPQWQVEVELLDRMDQPPGTKSASSNSFS